MAYVQNVKNLQGILIKHIENLDFEILQNIVSNNKYVILTNHSNEIARGGGFENFLAACNDVRSLKEDYYKFGFLCFEIFHRNFKTHPQNEPIVNFPLIHFFNPEELITFNQLTNFNPSCKPKISKFKLQFTQFEYIKIVQNLLQHIQKGDIYEINFCFHLEANGYIKPVDTYLILNHFSPSPFSCFVKYENLYLLSASPERFLQLKGNSLISQPIKGTAKRSKDEMEDKFLAENLRKSKKERSENVMIVDLVRNDLAMICEPGTVCVEELFGIYSYKHVHQMISTVVGKKVKDIPWLGCVEHLFPMGSMTGAPKHKAIELITKYEPLKRGLFSGSVGYVKPNGDFDFNVVIRSILYDDSCGKILINVGSAITAYSNPKQEYEECLLKAHALLKIFN